MRRITLFALAPLFFVAACSSGESAQDTPTPEAGSTVTQESSAAKESDQTTAQSSSKAKDSKRSAAGDADADPSTENTAASAGGTQEPVADSNQGDGASNRAVDYVASDYLDLVMHNPTPGQTATVAGTYYEVCILGDGFGLYTVLAGDNTSCDFGRAVFDAQTAGHNPTFENIRDFYQPEISVASPATGQTYNMQCSVLGDKSMECTGGNNARVVLY